MSEEQQQEESVQESSPTSQQEEQQQQGEEQQQQEQDRSLSVITASNEHQQQQQQQQQGGGGNDLRHLRHMQSKQHKDDLVQCFRINSEATGALRQLDETIAKSRHTKGKNLSVGATHDLLVALHHAEEGLYMIQVPDKVGGVRIKKKGGNNNNSLVGGPTIVRSSIVTGEKRSMSEVSSPNNNHMLPSNFDPTTPPKRPKTVAKLESGVASSVPPLVPRNVVPKPAPENVRPSKFKEIKAPEENRKEEINRKIKSQYDLWVVPQPGRKDKPRKEAEWQPPSKSALKVAEDFVPRVLDQVPGHKKCTQPATSHVSPPNFRFSQHARQVNLFGRATSPTRDYNNNRSASEEAVAAAEGQQQQQQQQEEEAGEAVKAAE